MGLQLRSEAALSITTDFSARHSASQFLQMESAALQAVYEQKASSSLLLWSSRPAVVVSNRDTRLPHFERACSRFQQENIEVVKRLSGGSAVPQGPGVLNLSLVFAPPEPRSIDQLYTEFVTGLADGFAALGLNTTVGEVAESFCDGRYNIVMAGRKLAGTAMKLKGRLGRPSVVLAHAIILAEMSPQVATDRVNRFYKLAGSTDQYSPAVSTSLALEIGTQNGLTEDLATAMVNSFSRY